MEKIVLSQNNVNLVRHGKSLLYFVVEDFEQAQRGEIPGAHGSGSPAALRERGRRETGNMKNTVPQMEVKHLAGKSLVTNGIREELNFYRNPGSEVVLAEAFAGNEKVLEKEYNAQDSAYQVLWDLPENSGLWVALEADLNKWQEFIVNFEF